MDDKEVVGKDGYWWKSPVSGEVIFLSLEDSEKIFAVFGRPAYLK